MKRRITFLLIAMAILVAGTSLEAKTTKKKAKAKAKTTQTSKKTSVSNNSASGLNIGLFVSDDYLKEGDDIEKSLIKAGFQKEAPLNIDGKPAMYDENGKLFTPQSIDGSLWHSAYGSFGTHRIPGQDLYQDHIVSKIASFKKGNVTVNLIYENSDNSEFLECVLITFPDESSCKSFLKQKKYDDSFLLYSIGDKTVVITDSPGA